MVGGGGGGGGCYNYGGGAGAAGGYSKKIISTSALSSTESVTVGLSGSGGAPQLPGGDGGTTSFGSHCSATGGQGGKAQTSLIYTTDGSLGGISIGGDLNLKETNAGSIALRVVYGKTEFMLTGDAPLSVEKSLVATYGEKLQSDVLKAGHHGSKTSSAESFVRAVNPQYVIFSRGCDNSYGHPHATIVTLFEKLKIPALDTCREGTITFLSDGARLQRQP
jgi:hypothetical protein